MWAGGGTRKVGAKVQRPLSTQSVLYRQKGGTRKVGAKVQRPVCLRLKLPCSRRNPQGRRKGTKTNFGISYSDSSTPQLSYPKRIVLIGENLITQY